jgi:anti-sigma factor RsiW
MTENDHQRVRQLSMAGRIEEISSADRQGLDSHLASCADCARFAASLDEAIGAARLPAVMADSSLVRATQSRVRRRAAQLQAHSAAMRPLWIAVAMVCAWATLTTPLLWAAFAWLGAALSLSNAEWRTGFLFAWIAPTLAASLLLLGSGSQRARWRMAFGQNSEGV